MIPLTSSLSRLPEARSQREARTRTLARKPAAMPWPCLDWWIWGVKARGEGPWRRQGRRWWVGVAAVGIAGGGSLSLDLD